MVAGVHNRYSYKLKAPTKEMIAAQGLGTVLRLARKLGPVLTLAFPLSLALYLFHDCD